MITGLATARNDTHTMDFPSCLASSSQLERCHYHFLFSPQLSLLMPGPAGDFNIVRPCEREDTWSLRSPESRGTPLSDVLTFISFHDQGIC